MLPALNAVMSGICAGLAVYRVLTQADPVATAFATGAAVLSALGAIHESIRRL